MIKSIYCYTDDFITYTFKNRGNKNKNSYNNKEDTFIQVKVQKYLNNKSRLMNK